jgi:hypothetical protein
MIGSVEAFLICKMVVMTFALTIVEMEEAMKKSGCPVCRIEHDAALQTAVSFMHSGGPISEEYALHFIRRIEHSTRKDIGYLPAFQRRVLETFEGWVGIVWSAVSGCR